MDTISNTPSKHPIAIVLVLTAASCIGCGKPMLYHFRHYQQPFAAIAESNKTYFHSTQTGKIIAKDPCGKYFEPGCFGYEPTSWTHWPEECPGHFPVQGEVIEERVPENGEWISEHAPGEYPQDAPTDVDPHALEQPEAVLPPNVPTVPEPVVSPEQTVPGDIESAVPSPSDGTKTYPIRLKSLTTKSARHIPPEVTTRLPPMNAVVETKHPQGTPHVATESKRHVSERETAVPRSTPQVALNPVKAPAATTKTITKSNVPRTNPEYLIAVGSTDPAVQQKAVGSKDVVVASEAMKVAVTKTVKKPLAVSKQGDPSSLADRPSSRAKSSSRRNAFAQASVEPQVEPLSQTGRKQPADHYLTPSSGSTTSAKQPAEPSKHQAVTSLAAEKLKKSQLAGSKLIVDTRANRQEEAPRLPSSRKAKQPVTWKASPSPAIETNLASRRKPQVKSSTEAILPSGVFLANPASLPAAPDQAVNKHATVSQKTALQVQDDHGANTIRFISDSGKPSTARLHATPKSTTVLRFSSR